MSLLDPPALPLPQIAPHSRVLHILYTAPYIKHLFADFLEAHPSSDLLETDAMVDTLSRIYVLGLKYTSTFWKDTADVSLQSDESELVAHLNLHRQARCKYKGRRPWEYFQPLWNQLTRDPLPSRKMRNDIAFDESDAETMVRIRLVHLVMRLVEAQIHPPKRPAAAVPRPRRIIGRIARRNKSEP